ncbi:hypothetical protein QCA50_020286 [Cerrena zonata]|uniref:Cytochrome P450 n=1 Tax=Cerrena zonata TaxID=2478898 RepID=A0AAW0F8B2_9APHY
MYFVDEKINIEDIGFPSKGSIISANVWTMLRNLEDYPDPEEFKPEQFIKDGKLDPNVRDPLTLVFDFGRRICPGRHLGSGSLSMMVASVLHTLEDHPLTGNNGEKFDPFSKVITGPISYVNSHYFGALFELNVVHAPEHVLCTLTARSTNAKRLVQQSSLSYETMG